MWWEWGLCGVVVLVLVAIGVEEGQAAWRKFRLSRRGEWIEADVVRVREDDDGEGGARFYPVVAFTPPDGDRVVAESPHYKTYPPGLGALPDDKVRVLYDPLKPERIELHGYRGDSLAKTCVTVILLFGCAVFLLVAQVFNAP
ncbi:DUF3592 domain-containing protein [Streptomyces sp. NPDC002276]